MDAKLNGFASHMYMDLILAGQIQENCILGAKNAESVKRFILIQNHLREYLQKGRYGCKRSLERKADSEKVYSLNSVPHYRYSICKNAVAVYEDGPRHKCCQWCGQKLDWKNK